MEVTEGGVTVSVPEQADAGRGDAVFFNPRMELNRDVTVGVLRAARERWGVASYLDATAATGVRGVRAADAGFDATLLDTDPRAVERCEANLARNDLGGTVRHRDANAFLHDHGHEFDVVDVDPFGTPTPFADAALANARTLVCVTATDTAPLCGAHFQSGVRKYSCVPRNTEYHAEVGLRVLLSMLARTAARYDVAVEPVLSHVSDHYARTYLALAEGASAADAAVGELGYVHHCPDCLWRTHARGLIADPPDACGRCGNRVVTAGPLWLGATHDPEFVTAVRLHLDGGMGERDRADGLLARLASELDEPTHYDQHELAERWNEPAVAMSEFLARLRDAGYAASRSHYGGTTFKTPASVGEIEAAAR